MALQDRGGRTIPDVVAEAIRSYPEPIKAAVLTLRELVLDTADEVDGVGRIEETLKWGQPSYLTPDTGSGTTIRIAPAPKRSAHDYGLFVHCGTDLVDRFRGAFGETFDYEGHRGLLFRTDDALPTNELRECIAMALTYHRPR